MRKRKRSAGTVLLIIGVVLLLTVWAPAVIIAPAVSFADHLAAFQMLLGFIIFFAGVKIDRREKRDPSYTFLLSWKIIAHIFTPSQLLMICALIFLFASMLTPRKREWQSSLFIVFMFCCLIAAVVVAVVRWVRKSKNAAAVKTTASVKSSNAALTKKREEEEMQEIKTEAQSPERQCAVCRRSVPVHALRIVDDSYFCDKCFRKQYGDT